MLIGYEPEGLKLIDQLFTFFSLLQVKESVCLLEMTNATIPHVILVGNSQTKI